MRVSITLAGFILLISLAFFSATASSKEYADGLPTIPESIIIPKWRIIGPFPLGVREAGTDPLAYFGDRRFENELLQGSFPSYLAPGAEVRWNYAFSNEKGEVTISFPNIPEKNWELIEDEWGFSGTLYTGYAYGVFEIGGSEPVYALIDLQNAGSFKLGEDSLSVEGVPWPGDSYGHNLWKQPVLLRTGRHLVRVGFTYRGNFTFRILPATEKLSVIESDITYPDIVRGKTTEALVGVPIVNQSGEWLEIKEIRPSRDDVFSSVRLLERARIAPLSVMKVPIVLERSESADTASLSSETYELPIKVIHSGGTAEATVRFRIRDVEQSRRETYISDIDRSIQYYAVLPPADYDPKKEYALILSLHGAGVEAEGQVDSYAPKDFAFVVAATNRRRFGFDWQDWGRLDTLQVLDEVKRNYPIDENRVHLTGHSMGGHGTWYLGLTYPDRWATAAPSAGWTNFPLYVPMFLRRNLTLGDPRANLIWELGMREDNTLALVENALNLPLYALEGGADDNVPPQQPRMLVELFRKYGYDITYEEVPGMGHWWDVSPDVPGADCVDWKGFNKFWKERRRDPLPKKVVFRTHNFSINNSAYWVSVFSPIRVYEDTRVEAEVVGRRALRVVTVNVKGLALSLPESLIGGIKVIPEARISEPSAIHLSIDGQKLRLKPDGDNNYYFIRNERGRWEEVGAEEVIGNLPAKREFRYGPWKQAFMHPFLLVYGTKGSEEETFWNLQLARFYAQAWWYRANGYTRIVADDEVTAEIENNYNIILIGSAKTNSYTDMIEKSLPIKLTNEGVMIGLYYDHKSIAGNRLTPGIDLTVKFVYPNPRAPRNLVLIQEAQSLVGFKRLFSFLEIYSGSGFPDWAIIGDEVEVLGIAGVTAMGFFNLDWEIDESLSSFNDELISRLSVGAER